ncbi:MAG: hypothetical protein IT349_09925 [Candidatus Eisenbacteria bacterium]|nr:hypothetical protein [Candidatus Eisenbacteria bacterium]
MRRSSRSIGTLRNTALLPLLSLCAGLCSGVLAGGAVQSLPSGGSTGTRVWTPTGETCSGALLAVHHDGTFEGGHAWDGYGVDTPYVGAWGEAYSLGPGTVRCVVLWHSQIGEYAGASTDVYLWSGGVTTEPDLVLAVVTGVQLAAIPVWPEVGVFEVALDASISGEFTAGSWGNWPGQYGQYFWLVDRDGPLGVPWTLVGVDTGWEPGWHLVPDVGPFGEVHSMGIGVRFEPDTPVPVAPASWGRVKRLFDPAGGSM